MKEIPDTKNLTKALELDLQDPSVEAQVLVGPVTTLAQAIRAHPTQSLLDHQQIAINKAFKRIYAQNSAFLEGVMVELARTGFGINRTMLPIMQTAFNLYVNDNSADTEPKHQLASDLLDRLDRVVADKKKLDDHQARALAQWIKKHRHQLQSPTAPPERRPEKRPKPKKADLG